MLHTRSSDGNVPALKLRKGSQDDVEKAEECFGGPCLGPLHPRPGLLLRASPLAHRQHRGLNP